MFKIKLVLDKFFCEYTFINKLSNVHGPAIKMIGIRLRMFKVFNIILRFLKEIFIIPEL